MSDSKKKPSAMNSIRTLPIDAGHAAKSDQSRETLSPAMPVARRKRRHSARLIALISLAAIAIIVYLSHSGLTQSYEGLGAALCAAACGVFFVRRFLGVLAEEDKLEEELINVNRATVAPLEPNPTGQQTNLTLEAKTDTK